MQEQTRKLTGTGIKSVNLGTRDEGFENEANDCVVKALQAITGVPYREAHAFCAKRFARRNRCGTPVHAYLNESLVVFGYRFISKEAKPISQSYSSFIGPRARYQTLADFVRSHRTGRWFACSNYHAFAVIDGVVYDNGAAGARTQVTFIYEAITDSDYEKRQGGI